MDFSNFNEETIVEPVDLKKLAVKKIGSSGPLQTVMEEENLNEVTKMSNM